VNASTELQSWFGLDGLVAVVTGGSGALGSAISRGLAAAGARVAVLGRNAATLDVAARELHAEGADALAVPTDVLDSKRLRTAAAQIVSRWDRIDILINAAGGNLPAATLADEQSVLRLDEEAFRYVVELNLLGTLLPTQVFGSAIVSSAQARGERPRGSIVNISSMAAHRAITRVAGYGAAKSAVENLTRSLAVELARSCGPGVRVNAVAPGFFIGEQNRRLLLDPDRELTPRGRAIIEHTPARRFGEAAELIATVVWLCGAGASFVTGTVVPVDGGFSAFAGV
jgi:NAD(P)-dependent dehydrogenase (short-subunit alcohol dehydrogenase family)